MSHARYAGMKVGAVNRSFTDTQIVQQGLIAQAILKTWTVENRAKIAKYRGQVMSLQKRADEINEWLEFKKHVSHAEAQEFEKDFNDRAAVANRLMKDLVEDYRDKMLKAGVTTATGYNFFDLRGPAFLIYPVNTPIRNQLPRWGKVNAGYGTMVNWKATTIGPSAGSSSQNYAGAAEGKRVGTSLPNEVNYVAQYSELGVERAVSFTAEFAGEGYTDNVGDEHLRGLHQLFLQEESIMLNGNQGAGANQNGFALGTANTPSGSLAASIPAGQPSDGSASGFANGVTVSAYVIELTALGYPTNAQYGYQAAPTPSATGLVPSYSRQDAGPYTADTDTINGGMGALSAASAVQTATTSTPFVKFSVVPKKGAIAWAWFIDDQDATTPSTANAFLAAITVVPYAYFGTNSRHAVIGTNQAASAAGLNADHSAQLLDFTGILATAAASGVWLNMSDISKIDPATGSTYTGLLQPTELGSTKVPGILQLDYDLQQQWNAFQTVADEAWMDAATKLYVNRAIMLAGNTNWRFDITRDQQNNILGAAVISAYTSPFSMKATGSDAIPLRIHPMIPTGMIVWRKTTNPYPHSRIPGVSGMFVQRDYYGVEWPVNKRQWEFGEYVHEVYGDYIPGLLTVRTGIQGVSTT